VGYSLKEFRRTAMRRLVASILKSEPKTRKKFDIVAVNRGYHPQVCVAAPGQQSAGRHENNGQFRPRGHYRRQLLYCSRDGSKFDFG
jgi:hypothetical protein